VADYSLSIKPSASKYVLSISDKSPLTQLFEKDKSLATQPRPSGSEKLAGRPNLYRIRQGNERVIYSIDDEWSLAQVISSLFTRYENVPASLADTALIRLAEINDSPVRHPTRCLASLLPSLP
jgi:mRNA interferase RelE/StbE